MIAKCIQGSRIDVHEGSTFASSATPMSRYFYLRNLFRQPHRSQTTYSRLMLRTLIRGQSHMRFPGTHWKIQANDGEVDSSHQTLRDAMVLLSRFKIGSSQLCRQEQPSGLNHRGFLQTLCMPNGLLRWVCKLDTLLGQYVDTSVVPRSVLETNSSLVIRFFSFLRNLYKHA